MDGQIHVNMGLNANMSQHSGGAIGRVSQRFGNGGLAMMNGDMNFQQTSRASNHSNHPQHQPYIDQAEDILRNQSDPDWHKKDEAYQRKFLRAMRLEMVDRAPSFDDGSLQDFRKLLSAAHRDIKRDYQIAEDALFQLTFTQLVEQSAHKFRSWMQFDRDRRECTLEAWDKVLNRLAFEDPSTRRFDRLLNILQVFQNKARLFNQEEVDLDREAALIEQASDAKSGQTVFELAEIYYQHNAIWTSKPDYYHVLFLNRLISTPTTGDGEKHIGVSLYKALEQRARFAKFDRKMRNEPGRYWPEPSYVQPDSPLDINWSIKYHKVNRPWNRNEAIHRFTRAWQDLSTEDFPYGHLPFEVALLLPLPRIDFPKLPQLQLPPKKSKAEDLSDEEACEEESTDGKSGEEDPEEDDVGEEEDDDDENEEEASGRTHVYSKGDIPFLPDPYPYKIADVKGHPTWTELQEFLAYVYGVDEGEMAERVITTDRWNTCRNLIRKRIAYKRTVHRILDPDTIPVRKGQVTEIAAQIVNGGGRIGRDSESIPALTDEQLLFNVTWDIDVWRGTMKQSGGADDAQTFDLPTAREIESEMLKKLLAGLGREIPTMDWLITKYPHIPDIRPRQATQPETEPNFGQSVPNTTSSVAGAMVIMSNSSTTLQEHPPQRQGLTRQGRSVHPQARSVHQQSPQQAAHLTAPMHAGVLQRHAFDSGVNRHQFDMQENERANGFDLDSSSEDQKKRGRHADVDDEDGFFGTVPKKNKPGFFNTILNDPDEPFYPMFESSSFGDGQQPQREPASIADMGEGGLRSPHFCLDSPPSAPQMLGRPALTIDESGHASVMMEWGQGNVEPEDDFLL